MHMSEIVVLTPLFDPTGAAFSLFGKTATSVLQQSNVDFVWKISLQDVSPLYENFLVQLARDERVEIIHRVGVSRLPEHLTKLIEETGDAKVHLLCQDDYYLNRLALLEISELLDKWDALFILPKANKRYFAHGAKYESDLSRFKENLGINTLGGLSTLAWNASRYGSSSKKLMYNLYADLEFRNVLRDNGKRNVAIVHGGKLIGETQWSGQAQFCMSELANSEATSWLVEHPILRHQVPFALYCASLYRNRQIKCALFGTYVQKNQRNIVIQIFGRLGDVSGIFRGAWVRSRRFVQGYE